MTGLYNCGSAGGLCSFAGQDYSSFRCLLQDKLYLLCTVIRVKNKTKKQSFIIQRKLLPIWEK